MSGKGVERTSTALLTLINIPGILFCVVTAGMIVRRGISDFAFDRAVQLAWLAFCCAIVGLTALAGVELKRGQTDSALSILVAQFATFCVGLGVFFYAVSFR